MADILGYLQQKGIPLKHAGGHEYNTTCFFCAEDPSKRGRLYINTDPDGEIPGAFKCHRCDAKGNLITLRRHFGDEEDAKPTEQTLARRSEVLSAAADYYNDRLGDYPSALAYLRGPKRGLELETIVEQKIGYAPANLATVMGRKESEVRPTRFLYEHLRELGFERQEILESGLCRPQGNKTVDSLAGMVTIPYFYNGSVVSIRGRTWPFDDDDWELWEQEGILRYEPPKGKYKTCGGDVQRLYNLDSIREVDEVVVCEGEADALVISQLGLPAVGAPGAKSWQDSWDYYFSDVKRIWLLFDRDEAGEKGAAKIEEKFGPKVRRIELSPEGTKFDPTDWVSSIRKEGLDPATELAKKMADSKSPIEWIADVDEAIAEFNEYQGQPGLKFGWELLDLMIDPGMQPSQLMIPLAKTGTGKCEPVSALIPTPSGFRRIGELEVGDEVFGRNGKPTRVTGVFPRGKRKTYRVGFSDGSSRLCGDDHLWEVQYRYGHNREWTSKVMSTLDLVNSDLRKGKEWRYRIPMCDPVRYPEKTLPIEPYTLGSLIANGSLNGTSATLTTPDPEVVDRIGQHHQVNARSAPPLACPRYGVLGVIAEIKSLGLDCLSSEKFIPEEYLLGSVEQRQALLQGLMDGDGAGSPKGRSRVRYSTTSSRLAADFVELVNSLGGTATSRVSVRPGKRDEFEISIMLPEGIEPFHSSRKRRGKVKYRTVPHRAITSIEEVGFEDSVCIAVEAEDHLYLSGREYVVTHNTVWCLNMMQRIRMVPGQSDMKMLFVSLEQTRGEWWDRARRIHRFYNLESSEKDARDWWFDNIIIADKNMVTPENFMRLLDDFDYRMGQLPDLIVVDYLGYFARGFKGEQYARVSDAVMWLKGLVKETKTRMIVPHQVSRVGKDGEEFGSDAARDSVVGSTLVQLADGSRRPIRDLVDTQPELVVLDNNFKFTTRKADRVWKKGERDVYKVTLQSGRTVTCTDSHPFFTIHGWERLADLTVGGRVAVPRDVPVFGDEDFPHAQLVGMLIADGGLTTTPTTFTKGEAELRELCISLARKAGAEPTVRADDERQLSLSAGGGNNPLTDYLRSIGVWGVKSPDRRVPEAIWTARQRDVALFIRGIWSCDGSMKAKSRELTYSSSSRGLIDDLRTLLLRFGIRATVSSEHYSDGGYAGGEYFILHVQGSEQIERFAEWIGLDGEKGRKLDLLAGTSWNPSKYDSLPSDVWSHIHAVRKRRGLTWADVFGSTGVDERRALSRDRALRIAHNLDDPWLEALATGHLFFEAIESIEPAGREDVFDISVVGLHNFVANDIVVKNSGVVEETGDFVLPIWSPDNSLNRNEAEKSGRIHARIAKSRHGGRGVLLNMQWAPLSLAMVPEGDPMGIQARREFSWRQEYADNWEKALYRHVTGFNGHISDQLERRIREGITDYEQLKLLK